MKTNKLLTLLPYPDFADSAAVLDSARLKKQRQVAWTILTILRTGPKQSNGKPTLHFNDPAVQMWKGYEGALIMLGYTLCLTWRGRGKQDNMLPNFQAALARDYHVPTWMGNSKIHDSHKSLLLREDPALFGLEGWNIDSNLPIYYPCT